MSSESEDAPPSPDESAERQRARLLAATIDVAGEQGWDGMTLREVVRRAGLSKRTVYDLYEDKQACFLAAATDVIERVSGITLGACREAGGSGDGLAAGIDGLLRFCGEDPRAARVYLIETASAGPAGAALWREHMEEMSRQAERALQDVGQPLPPFASSIAVGGIYTLAQTRVLAGDASDLPQLAPAMTDALWTTLGIGGR
jgi:AcrR family transcriptional regulator